MTTRVYNVLLARVSTAQTEVEYNGVKVKADVPSLIVQLQPVDIPDENSNIKLIFPGSQGEPEFVEGGQVAVTFAAV